MTDTPRVLMFPADNTACGHYRMTWPAEILQAQGWNIDVVFPSERAQSLQCAYTVDDDGVKHPTEVFLPSGYDVIVLQRVSHSLLARAIPLIRAKGIAVVVDIDDDLSAIHPSNPAFVTLHPKHATDREHSWHNVVRACESATLATVSTPALTQRYGRRGNARVLRNCVPARYLSITHEDSALVGWAAGLHSHLNDVDALGSSIARLQYDGFTYGHLGDNVNRVHKVLGLPEVPQDLGIADLAEWPSYLTRIGIGIAPLADTAFNRAKSWLKPLEMAALGVPCVMSPRDEYREIHKRGVGTLAKSPSEFYRRIRYLATSALYRQELAGQSREAVRSHDLTYEGQAWQWGKVWTEAALLR